MKTGRPNLSQSCNGSEESVGSCWERALSLSNTPVTRRRSPDSRQPSVLTGFDRNPGILDNIGVSVDQRSYFDQYHPVDREISESYEVTPVSGLSRELSRATSSLLVNGENLEPTQ